MTREPLPPELLSAGQRRGKAVDYKSTASGNLFSDQEAVFYAQSVGHTADIQ